MRQSEAAAETWGFVVPADLARAVEAERERRSRAEERVVGRSEIIRKALRRYLEEPRT